MKNIIKISLIIFILAAFLTGCQASTSQDDKLSVGIFMPCNVDGSWQQDAEEMKTILVNQGYQANIFFADKDPKKQVNQINQSINAGADALIISPVDNNLSNVLKRAKKQDIKVISYGKLIQDTDAISYYASYDDSLIGIQLGQSLIEGLHAQGDGPYNIEIFPSYGCVAGSSNNFNTALSVIRPLIDSGEIIIPSGQTTINDIVEGEWNKTVATERLKNLLNEYYSDGTPLNGILSPGDHMSLEFIDILNDEMMYKSSTHPIITGQNAEPESIKAIANGQQYSTIYKDTQLLAQIACSMVMALLNDEIPEINDDTTYFNGVKTVPAYLCETILITKYNYEEVLLDTGYYTYEDIFGS